jgi:hypothetical protein
MKFDLMTQRLTAASGMMLKNEMTNLTVAGQLTNLAEGGFKRRSYKRDGRNGNGSDTRTSPANELDAHPDYSPAIVTGTVTRSTLSQPCVKRNHDDLRGRNVFAG